MDQRRSQGWQADPFGLHEQRYFSAGRPTKLVRDGAVEAYDEPPLRQSTPAAAVIEARARSASLADAAARPDLACTDPTALGPAAAPYPDIPAARRRTGLVYSVVALAAAAAVIAFVAIVGPGSTSSPPGPAGVDLTAFVTASARQTLAEQTADIALAATVNLGGTAVGLHGNGQLDLAAFTGTFNLSGTFPGGTFAENEIFTSQAAYLQVIVDGRSMARYLGGRDWLEVPLARPPAQVVPQDNPAWSLQLLEHAGKVVPLGAERVGGLSCDAYAVTPSRQAMLAAAQRGWADEGLSSSETAAAQHVLEDTAPPAITVWLDPARRLTCQLAVSMRLSTGSPAGSGSASATEGVQMLMTFTHYGVPVTINQPAQSDTYSLAG